RPPAFRVPRAYGPQALAFAPDGSIVVGGMKQDASFPFEMLTVAKGSGTDGSLAWEVNFPGQARSVATFANGDVLAGGWFQFKNGCQPWSYGRSLVLMRLRGSDGYDAGACGNGDLDPGEQCDDG